MENRKRKYTLLILVRKQILQILQKITQDMKKLHHPVTINYITARKIYIKRGSVA
jgi:hypothetical protein